ncbi:MAG: right-handed parallel beta-helix repeat-containing protein [Deltaproteobacteria bacterium]|nr:MAG: right-handed parallel beta-helix repeat-containing protein [Deltaproteobacteria bacterium]TMB14086.1 MAG: right-handed parallel beta-helix repeat-containing protein [Deltaproteobacteria bacterium]
MCGMTDPVEAIARALLAAVLLALLPLEAIATTYYVRQTVGDDAHDGTSPATAWQHAAKLSAAMHAGDVAYIGPGLYREQITVLNDGGPDARITFIADTTGTHTGDPPGIVMITGADPMDVSGFVPEGSPGVYKAPFSRSIFDLVEMEGDQYRYWRVKSRKELPLPEGVSEVDLVRQRPYSMYYDEDAKMLYVHTSDDKPPSTHEIEYMSRDSGIRIAQKHYVTVVGFTFRHVLDGGITMYSASNCIAVNNTSYGNRQGIRVYNAPDNSAYGNTLFRNENCGIYFALGSTNGLVVGNTMYENIKGIRWSSQSANGTAVDNVLFENHEYGISVESTDHVLLRRNRMLNNDKAQFSTFEGAYSSDDSCFANGGPDQLLAALIFVGQYRTLADYQHARRQDLSSREGDCGPLPAKVDVHKLHEETKSYAERARRILSGAEGRASEASKSPAPEGSAGSWLKWLLGR